MNSETLVSVIVPIYKGTKYIPHIIEQIENNTKLLCDERNSDQCVKGELVIELILVNDYPKEKLCKYESAMIEIVTIQTNVNRGIHGARIMGLERASGRFVLFFDQDDEIKANYLKSQLECIGDNDASVCRLIHNKRYHYTDTFVFENVITKEFILDSWCPIISPGQVLLNRASIPDEWKINILKNNGADDYFLWILLMLKEKKIALNNEVLFEHIMNGFNTSDDISEMMDSESEMIDYLEKIYNDDKNITRFELLRQSLKNIHKKICDSNSYMIKRLSEWKYYLENDMEQAKWLKNHKYNSIAIYGAGQLGLELEKLFRAHGINIKCFIDRNAKYVISDIKSYTLEEYNSEIDAVFLTVKDENLPEIIERKLNCEVIEI